VQVALYITLRDLVARSSAGPWSDFIGNTAPPVYDNFHLQLKCLTVPEETPTPSQIPIIRCAINDMPPRGDKSALKRSRVRRLTDPDIFNELES
jgi:hypothetical protein